MKKSASWLLETEEIAAALFAEAAKKLSHRPEYYDFLMQLSEDEREHVGLIKSLIDFLSKNSFIKPALTLSDQTKTNIRSTLMAFSEKIAGHEVETGELLKILIDIEMSEFNFFTVYLIELAKEFDKGFTPALVNMQGHLSAIRRFVEKHGDEDHIDLLKGLPRVWDEKILVVDPSKALVNLLDHLMTDEASLTGTSDGNKAYDMILETYYSAIIMEVHLDGMNGKDLYRKVVKIHPGLKERTIFMTSDDSKENMSFFDKNNVEFIIKPGKVLHLKDRITRTINKSRRAC